MSPRDVPQEWLDYIKQHFAGVAFFGFLGAKVNRVSRGEAEIKLLSRPEFANTYGITHGGVMAALADMAMGVAGRTLKVRIVTIEMAVNYFAPAPIQGELTAIARVIHEGRRTLAGEVAICDENANLLAKGKGTFLIIGEDSTET